MLLDSDALRRIRPMRLRLVKEPFDNPDYIFELKQDGFRATAYIDQGDAWMPEASYCICWHS